MASIILPTDLTQRPPRSPRARLGGFVILPRMIDKGRAKNAGKIGEYNYDCSMDKHFTGFIGIDPGALLKELSTGKGDGDILQWILANAKNPRSAWEIEAWSSYFDRRVPDSDNETLLFFAEQVAKFSKTREDVKTWFDLLDVDDYVSFGGKA